MSSAKFYVLGGGRWRELDTSAGRVEGWGNARFLYVERGRLRAVKRAPVLRGLRSLAAGRACIVHDGAPLSQIRHTEIVKNKRAPCSLRERRGLCQHSLCGCGVKEHFNMQTVRVEHAAVQADPDHAPALHDNTINIKSIAKKKQTEVAVLHQNVIRLNSSDEDLSASVMEWNRKRKMREIRGAELCKELIIAEEDVMLLRNFIEKDQKNVFKVDLERFDADDTYKSKVFYKLNPLVNVERCKAIADMTWDRRSQSTVTLRDFITNLGLRRVDDPSPSTTGYRMRKRRDTRKPRESESEQDKENQSSRRRPKTNGRRNKVLGESLGGKLNGDRVKNKVKASGAPSEATRGSRRLEESEVAEVSDGDGDLERTEPEATGAQVAALHERAAGGGREYGSAEDAAIVRWLRRGGRGHLVNGNRLWRELQPEHRRLTGRDRSWHSLRNRYLRYLLPSLGALLPSSAASALRAAAARGEIKARRPEPPSRRHSPPAPPPVVGAWARRPPDRAARPLKNISEPARSLRSSGAFAAAPAPPGTPTYSELTERFASRRRAPPDSDASGGTEPERPPRRASRRLRAADSSVRLAETSSGSIAASVRRAENAPWDVDASSERTAGSGRGAPAPSPMTDAVDRRKPRTRRLYNPNL